MRKRTAFTLIELLVVIGIIGILAGILIPAVIAAQRKAQQVQCLNNLHQIRLSFIKYSIDHDQRFPDLVDARGVEVPAVADDGTVSTEPARSAFALLLKKGYLSTAEVFICPSTRDRIPEGFPARFKRAELGELILPENGCSYGCDPTKNRLVHDGCAIAADKPLANVSPADEGTDLNNSPNHLGAGQNVLYAGGHVKWATNPGPYPGLDVDIYIGDHGYETSDVDAEIRR